MKLNDIDRARRTLKLKKYPLAVLLRLFILLTGCSSNSCDLEVANGTDSTTAFADTSAIAEIV